MMEVILTSTNDNKIMSWCLQSFHQNRNYFCGFSNLPFSIIIVVEINLKYFTTIMKDGLWQSPAKLVFHGGADQAY